MMPLMTNPRITSLPAVIETLALPLPCPRPRPRRPSEVLQTSPNRTDLPVRCGPVLARSQPHSEVYLIRSSAAPSDPSPPASKPLNSPVRPRCSARAAPSERTLHHTVGVIHRPTLTTETAPQKRQWPAPVGNGLQTLNDTTFRNNEHTLLSCARVGRNWNQVCISFCARTGRSHLTPRAHRVLVPTGPANQRSNGKLRSLFCGFSSPAGR